jgi:hypothetical protein
MDKKTYRTTRAFAKDEGNPEVEIIIKTLLDTGCCPSALFLDGLHTDSQSENDCVNCWRVALKIKEPDND